MLTNNHRSNFIVLQDDARGTWRQQWHNSDWRNPCEQTVRTVPHPCQMPDTISISVNAQATWSRTRTWHHRKHIHAHAISTCFECIVRHMRSRKRLAHLQAHSNFRRSHHTMQWHHMADKGGPAQAQLLWLAHASSNMPHRQLQRRRGARPLQRLATYGRARRPCHRRLGHLICQSR